MAESRTESPLDPARIRAAEFPRLADSIYLNAAAYAPVPERAHRALVASLERRVAIQELTDQALTDALVSTRSTAARMVGAEAGEIALGWNASYGINLAALSLPVEPGTTVVVSDREFPANVYPWMGKKDTKLDVVPVAPSGRPDEDRLMERLDRGDVSIFTMSSVQFATGYRADLAKLGRFCRERGIFFVVDAIQSLGQLPLDVRELHIDVLATGGHKWLCSPFGTGFAYVRRELIARMEPRWIGWTGMQACSSLESLVDYEWTFRSDARRFEGGTLPYDGYAGLAASLGLLLEVGVDRIERHVLTVLDPLIAWLLETPEAEILSDLNPDCRSAILCFRLPEAERVFEELRGQGVACALREGAIRVAPHLYTSAEQIERVVEILDQCRARRWS
ncbi:MAG: aminotransferase class V-fold PLP-dependent enzyme [Gemmatimonadetes bacterium]|nr:aminotransferase class V-fold PLP-dependent enzyme [Gemmatimonadota bacterium]